MNKESNPSGLNSLDGWKSIEHDGSGYELTQEILVNLLDMSYDSSIGGVSTIIVHPDMRSKIGNLLHEGKVKTTLFGNKAPTEAQWKKVKFGPRPFPSKRSSKRG